ncbi:MAG: MFS transporter [Candidatus Bathyarchaeota archaeon]|jgi:MFS family permease|nr:MFS transporter [Candidatus Bathyarchaeota archaeon]
MKRILTITFLNFFISGGLTLIIPLLLLERNVDLVEIGLVLSILPLVFLLVRLVIALIADSRGWNRLHLLFNWPGSVISVLIYLVANSTPFFLFGKIFEAIKESSFWALNRTAIFSLSPNREVKEATRNTAVIFLSTAMGSAIAGLTLSYFGFTITLGVFAIFALLIAVPAALCWKNDNQNLKITPSGFGKIVNFRNYGKTFWLISITLLLFSLAFYPLLNLLIPVFMAQQLGYSYVTIGIAFMLFNLVASAAIFGTLKTPLGIKRVIIQLAIGLSASFLLAFANYYFLVLFFMLAISEGLGMGFFEAIIAKATKGKPSVSIDIGMLHIPMRFAEFASLLYAGFIAKRLGYAPLFVSSGVFFLLFSLLALHFVRK